MPGSWIPASPIRALITGWVLPSGMYICVDRPFLFGHERRRSSILCLINQQITSCIAHEGHGISGLLPRYMVASECRSVGAGYGKSRCLSDSPKASYESWQKLWQLRRWHSGSQADPVSPHDAVLRFLFPRSIASCSARYRCFKSDHRGPRSVLVVDAHWRGRYVPDNQLIDQVANRCTENCRDLTTLTCAISQQLNIDRAKSHAVTLTRFLHV